VYSSHHGTCTIRKRRRRRRRRSMREPCTLSHSLTGCDGRQ